MLPTLARSNFDRSTKLGSLSLVIPAYNDATTVTRLIRDSVEVLQQVSDDFEIIVINDGSKDNTLEVLTEVADELPNVRLINHEVNRGFGETIKELYYAGRGEYVFSLPGDYQYAPKELLVMVQGLEKFDLVIGLRKHRNDPPRRKFQSFIYNSLLTLIYGNRHKDVNSIKLFKRSILNRIVLRSNTAFVDAELVIRSEKAGFKIVEIPIEHLPRLSQGASGGKISVILETFKDLFSMRATL